MSKEIKRFISFSFYSVFVSGLIIAILKYFFETQDEFGTNSHFLLDEAKLAHYLITPLLVFSIGSIWSEHIATSIKNVSKRRKTGILIISLFIASVLSGQLILGLNNLELTNITGIIHSLFGLFLTITFFIHKKYS